MMFQYRNAMAVVLGGRICRQSFGLIFNRVHPAPKICGLAGLHPVGQVLL